MDLFLYPRLKMLMIGQERGDIVYEIATRKELDVDPMHSYSETLDIQMKPNFLSIKDLRLVEQSRFPFWVFDIDNTCVTWANPVGLDLWRAESVEILRERSMQSEMSSSVKARLKQFQTDFWEEAIFDEMWTMYPDGKPVKLLCRFRGCTLEDGRMGMLCEGQILEQEPTELLRGAQALLYTGVMVSTYSVNGKCLYANPAARRAFPPNGIDIAERLLDRELRHKLLNFEEIEYEGTSLCRVKTSEGERLHQIEAKLSFDVATGERSLLLTENDVTESERAKAETIYLANHDTLTDLKNRTYISKNADNFINDAFEQGQAVFLSLMDLDRFKYINDTFGHPAGDDLLIEIANRLNSFLPEDSIAARLGGDEICFLVKGPKYSRQAHTICAKVLASIREPIFVQDHELRLSASIGMSQSVGVRRTFDAMLQQADLALFDAKANGGNRTSIFRPELADKSSDFLRYETELKDALKDNRLELYFQPKVSLEFDRVVGAEALLRMHTADGRILYPNDFIPVAEATGLINELGRWVLEDAARHHLELRNQGINVELSVNVSPKQFLDPNFVPLLRSFLSMPNFEPEQFELEITEAVLLADDNRLKLILNEVTDMGYRLSIDDFGTAYANMASLQRYPIHCIKIDRSLFLNENHEILALSVINIAKALKVKVVAEGVESTQVRDWLYENGCDEYQGYLFSQPVPYDAFIKFLGMPC